MHDKRRKRPHYHLFLYKLDLNLLLTRNKSCRQVCYEENLSLKQGEALFVLKEASSRIKETPSLIKGKLFLFSST